METVNGPCVNPDHKAHKRYIGGIMDGQTDHLLYARGDLASYPQTVATIPRGGQRSWYELDQQASTTTDVVYRCVAVGVTNGT